LADILHPELYDSEVPLGSYWEETAGPPVEGCPPLDGDQACDVAVIGAGYTGLSAALELAQLGFDVRVLEAAEPGWGASGRNVGMVCMGGAFLSLEALVKRFGMAEARRFIDVQRQAMNLVRSLAETYRLSIDAQGDAEVMVAHTPRHLQELRDDAEGYGRLGYRCRLLDREGLAEVSHRSPEAFGALVMPGAFGLHPLKYARGLARATLLAGAVIHARSAVTGWERNGAIAGDGHRLVTPGGSLRARRVLVATNAFTREALHPAFAGGYIGAITQMIVTRPLNDEELARYGWRSDAPACDLRRLLTDYRILPDRRLLMGGPGGTIGSPASARRWTAFMKRRLKRKFPDWAGVDVTHSWRGPWCISSSLTPNVGRLVDEPTVFHSLAYQGCGIALGSWCGRAVARAIAGREPTETLPAVLRGRPKRFPFARFRLWGQRAAFLGYRVKDRWT
jgi:glycine/D-amino acid oxidase-like deaminating enzyme